MCILRMACVYGLLRAEMERDRNDWKNADVPEGIRQWHVRGITTRGPEPYHLF